VRPGCSFVVAGSPAQLTGGYLYDARIAAGLRERGWRVATHGLEGCFPLPDGEARRAFADCLASHPDGACVVIDGLVLGGLPEVARAHSARLELVALVHHPLAQESGLDPAARCAFARSERLALACVRRTVVTSAFTARQLAAYGVPAARIHVVEPGVDPAPLAAADHDPARLLCVASLTPRKGHLVLVEALAALRSRAWSCTLVGSTARDPAHAARVIAAIAANDLSRRIALPGERAPPLLREHYLGADLFVLPSLFEGYGMVVSEAVAHGLPVLATHGGALAETLPAGAGVLVPPGDAAALAGALQVLLQDAGARARLREGARRARANLRDWQHAAGLFADALAAGPS
jgi:glycosyltransferase involved in cell wall biosynthesis